MCEVVFQKSDAVDDAYLLDELLIDRDISTWAIKGLLQEGKKNGNDDRNLQSLAKDNEEDGDGKYINSHGCMIDRDRVPIAH